MQEKVYVFQDSLQAGKRGEEKIIKFLLETDEILSVKDLRNHNRYQTDDIDIIATDYNHKDYTIEIKTDSYTTGNLFYETYSCIETGSLGCLEKTKADYILYYFEGYGKLLVLETQSFREFFARNKKNFKKRTVKNKRRNGDTYTTEGYLIPISFIEKFYAECTVVKI